MQFIILDSRANYDEDAATCLEAFSAKDEKAAIKYAKKEWGEQLAVLYKVVKNKSEWVAVID